MKSIAKYTIVSALAAFGALATFAPTAQGEGGLPRWTNYYNGPENGSDQAYAVAVASNGNVFVTGGSADYATVAYSGAGVALWTNRYNGPGDDVDSAKAIAVDSSGNVFVTGGSTATNGYYDYATIKYSGGGVPLWTNRYNRPANQGDNNEDFARAIAVDGSGNVIVTGWTYSFASSYDYLTIKYSNAGVPLWTNRYSASPASGSTPDLAAAVAADSSGNVFVTGHSYASGSGYDYLTIKYSSAGVPLWTNRYNRSGGNDDVATAIAVDSSGKVLVTGYSYTTNTFPYNTVYETIAYANTGFPVWTNSYHGPRDGNSANAVACGANGDVFVTGSSGSYGSTICSTIAISSAGIPLWTNNGPENTTGEAVAVDGSGNVFVTGTGASVAYSRAGVPLWTNINGFSLYALAVDSTGNVFVTGASGSGYVTIKYSSSIAPPVYLALEPDGSAGYFIRFNGGPGFTYRLQRAAIVTGPWLGVSTNTAPVSGLIEFHDTNPPPDGAFYRTAQP
jgi:hypothetical protein